MHIASKQCPAQVLRRIIELLNIGNNDDNGLASIVYHFFFPVKIHFQDCCELGEGHLGSPK